MSETDERKILLENNQMLHKLVRAQRWNSFFTFLRWMFIIAISLGAYYYLQPYWTSLGETYDNLSSQVPALKSLLPIKPF